ncbi:hypothetical protein [Atlantibacter subterraneus]|uniref:hypothetical protein n=1 Tax=Atlantibacter subterraneus TaxID=255519 RepID=UPI00289A3AA4|nr:hypothetical protein [Atlantibacter subterranea]
MTINERVSDLIEKFTSDDMAALRRFVECCEDPDAGGHDVEKNIITRLSQYGALRQVRPGYHEVTEFGEFILNGGIDELQQYRAAAEPVAWQYWVISEASGFIGMRGVCMEPEKPPKVDGCKTKSIPLYAAPQVTSVPDGIEAAAKWVDAQREAYDDEHGRYDPDTSTFEFGNDAQLEYSTTLAEIAEGIRALHPAAAPAVQAEQTKRLIGWRTTDYTEETSDPEMAKNWAAAVGVLPVFEGDINTRLQAEPLSVDTLANVLRNAPDAPSDNQGKKRVKCIGQQLSGNTEQVSQPYTLPSDVRNALVLALQAMEFMGDTLNNLDAVCTEDVEHVTPAFEAVRTVLADNSPAIPDGWIPVRERMPEPKSERRVCAYTPTPHEDMRYRFVPASLFKTVCSSATHWYYMEPPAAPKQEAE